MNSCYIEYKFKTSTDETIFGQIEWNCYKNIFTTGDTVCQLLVSKENGKLFKLTSLHFEDNKE
ncbi:MAG: hypothetical protein JNM67_05325 [Bacteroidetes bacterium]|nr:hypothetical protein [Bacteroidota bacterium]